MFGDKKLLSDGAQTEGLVTKASYMDPGFHKKLMVHVRVRFPDGTEHEFLETGLWIDDVGQLFPGSVVPVRYNPAKPSKVMLDRPALKERHAPIRARKEAELEAQLKAGFEQLEADRTGASDAGSAEAPASVQPFESAVQGATPSDATGISVGQRVTYREVASGETKIRTIVSKTMPDRAAGEIAATSPVAAALIGHAPGDRVTVSPLMGGLIELEIVAIEEPGR